jgi:hypothetical protein
MAWDGGDEPSVDLDPGVAAALGEGNIASQSLDFSDEVPSFHKSSLAPLPIQVSRACLFNRPNQRIGRRGHWPAFEADDAPSSGFRHSDECSWRSSVRPNVVPGCRTDGQASKYLRRRDGSF